MNDARQNAGQVVSNSKRNEAKSFASRRERQGRSQCEAERRLGRNFNLLVSGECPAHQTSSRAHESANSRSLTSTCKPTNQCTPGRSSAGGGSRPLAFPFLRAAQYVRFDRISVPPHRDAG